MGWQTNLVGTSVVSPMLVLVACCLLLWTANSLCRFCFCWKTLLWSVCATRTIEILNILIHNCCTATLVCDKSIPMTCAKHTDWITVQSYEGEDLCWITLTLSHTINAPYEYLTIVLLEEVSEHTVTPKGCVKQYDLYLHSQSCI